MKSKKVYYLQKYNFNNPKQYNVEFTTLSVLLLFTEFFIVTREGMFQL